ncbi:MAG: acyl-CoA thioesterase, partial [Bdellovibrionales bacterium]
MLQPRYLYGMQSGPVEIEMFVHFDDGDPAGIAFFANYFRLAERAFELSLNNSPITWQEWFDHPEWGVPLKHVEAEYKRPLRPGHKCFVRQRVTELGDSSLVLLSEVLDDQKNLCAEVRTTHVFINKQLMKKMSIPDHIRAFLKSR